MRTSTSPGPAELAFEPPSGPNYAALNRRNLVRTLVAVATFVVAWLVVSPSSASAFERSRAPVCDPRGAIGFAPPPQIQDAELSLDIPADCFDVNPLESRNVVPGRGTPLDISSSQEPLAATTLSMPTLAFTERLPVRVVVEARPPPGVCGSLERPPRT